MSASMNPSSRWLRPAALVLGVLALAAALAAVGGWWWWKWWSPAGDGQIYRDQTGHYGWYANPLDPGQAHVTSSTFEYVVVCFVLALVAGAVAGVLGRNRALITLVVVVVAGVLGAWLTHQVGMALSPPDPDRWADQAHLGKTYPGHLSVAGWSPYLAWPVGALLGFLAVMLSISSDTTSSARPPSPEETGSRSSPAVPPAAGR